jgi:glycosyltransferase involved in cell wall biosynthesis
MKVSIVLRTYNEQRHLEELLRGIEAQDHDDFDIETIIVDSGSTDNTLKIASNFSTIVVPIKKEEFSFGRSLNIGCAAATGDILIFISGHCIPVNSRWITELIAPLRQDGIAYSYGGQIGNHESHFSECQIFLKYFPLASKIPQDGFYCNNANAAVRKDVWQQFRYDEDLTGLEDMHLAKKLVAIGYKVAYVAEAAVYHLHNETWAQVRRRFEREAIALQHIMPEVHISWTDMLRYFLSAIFLDLGAALQQNCMRKNMKHILMYRFMQFTGSYKGNHFHRQLSRQVKDKFFYPR